MPTTYYYYHAAWFAAQGQGLAWSRAERDALGDRALHRVQVGAVRASKPLRRTELCSRVAWIACALSPSHSPSLPGNPEKTQKNSS